MLLSQLFKTEERVDNTHFNEQSFIESVPDGQLAEVLAAVGTTADLRKHDVFDNGIDRFVAEHPHQNQDSGFQHPLNISDQKNLLK